MDISFVFAFFFFLEIFDMIEGLLYLFCFSSIETLIVQDTVLGTFVYALTAEMLSKDKSKTIYKANC